ncbi:MAG TPA: hypothetical protein VOA41_12385 [Candidatus Dormibacteraeota bacterium]|nr:hypothetical protein [Candidatus Dormibacteraeota bacterium]
MGEHLNSPVEGQPTRIDLKTYAVTLPMASLAVGVDNIHHDVFLSPRFIQFTRGYLLDLIRQSTATTYFSGLDVRPSRPPETSVFKKILSELLHASLTRAKYEKNIEIDFLFRIALIKFLTQEIGNQFANLILEGKEWVRQRGEHFERSEQAHVMKARLSELQAGRRNVVRQVGQQIHQYLVDVEENVLAKSRRALFGEEFGSPYDLLKNRLVFVEGGKDDVLFAEQYVLLGNYVRDPDRFEAMDTLLLEFVRDSVLAVEHTAEIPDDLQKTHSSLVEQALTSRSELVQLEEEREALLRKLERSEGLLSKLVRAADPSDVRAALSEVEKRIRSNHMKLEELSPQLDSAKQKASFLSGQRQSRLADYLNEPENAHRLFDPDAQSSGAPELRNKLLEDWIARLEQRELIVHILASYEVRSIFRDYCPPIHLQQLRKALVSRDELKSVEDILKQFPARRFSMKPIEELSKKVRRFSHSEIRATVLRFTEDFMRLRRARRNFEHLTTCMERINLITNEKTRELSRLNNTLYECVLPDEARPTEDRVVSHVIIKADVRGSTKITHDLLDRGLNPASHFSLNFHEPVTKLLDRFGAAKVFIEGDAIVLAIFETEANRSYQRPVAKACVLARQILAVSAAYNQRAESSDLPRLELGIGVAFQSSAPTYWINGDSRIMISKALNLSDRLSGCSKMARRLLARNPSLFCMFLFQTSMEGASEEEAEELLIRFNLNGIELNEEGFQKLAEEISMDTVETKLDTPWGRQPVTLYFGELPMGDSLELIVVRKGYVRQLQTDGKIGPSSTTRPYYEVCSSPRLVELVEALLRTQSAKVETARVSPL